MKKLSLKKPATFPRLTYKIGVSLILIAALALFAGSGYYWYKNVLINPDRVLSDMLDKSLQTSGVTRTITQDSGRSKVDQNVYLSFTPQTAAKSVTDLEEISETGKAKVTTETLGTKDSDFVRYTSINVESGKQPSYDKVLNVWGTRKSDEQTASQVTFLNEALFVVVPFGNLNSNQRAELKKEIIDSSLYTISSSSKEFVNGRPVITYELQINPQSLVKVLAKYVQMTGVGSDAELNPASYEGAASVPVKMHIDVLSRHLKSIEFSGSGRTETYTSYNSRQVISTPNDTISIDELQKRLSAVEPQQQQQQ